MLSVEMKINGRLVVHLYGHNEGYAYKRGAEDFYHYEIYEINSGMEVSKGHVYHNRDDGLVKLVSTMLKDYLSA